MQNNNTTLQSYSNNKKRYIEIPLRSFFGIQQLWFHPYYIVFLFIPFSLFLVAWQHKYFFIPTIFIPDIIRPYLEPFIEFLLISAIIMVELVIIKYIGILSAIDIESHLSEAFTSYCKQTNTPMPILFSRIRSKKSKVTTLIFYTSIPKNIWVSQTEDISDKLDMQIIEICYGGKNNHTSKFIVLKTLPGKILPQRGTLYDAEF